MSDYRIKEHPVLEVVLRSTPTVNFTWNNSPMYAKEGETIAAALFANGIHTFGHHHKDNAPLGIFCANGQCAQCSVLADGVSVKSCMTQIQDGMSIVSLNGKPVLPDVGETTITFDNIETISIECLILGGGPAGLSAAIELAKSGVEVIIVDDKSQLGGKLVLQTHKFFGSIEACHAGTRGMDIGARLDGEVRGYPNIHIWTNSNALAVFSDQKVGVLRNGRYYLIQPKALLVATGAREKSLIFKGNSLPGVYGAGAFQTMVNRDLIKPTSRLFIIGGGNVGLITAYHALQAGIEVVGLCEALPECGGYKVHKDKIVRMGIPIYTSHTIVAANGVSDVASVTIAKLDDHWNPLMATAKTLQCDTVLIAVGLESVNEFYIKAKQFNLPVFVAGDAEEIAEASVAMFTGKMRGAEIAKVLGHKTPEIMPEWHDTATMLKTHPGAIFTEEIVASESGVFPVFHCMQEIPCNPCTSICPAHAIRIESGSLLGVPKFFGDQCIGCERCVAICPGLAITLVDYRQSTNEVLVTIPYEFSEAMLQMGEMVTVLDTLGNSLGLMPVASIKMPKFADRTALVKVRVPLDIAKRIAGIRIQVPDVDNSIPDLVDIVTDDAIVCRCERVTVGEIKQKIRAGIRDLNELKGATRSGMGACGGKTCASLIKRIFVEEGVPLSDVTEFTHRPLFMEVPMGAFAGLMQDANLRNDFGNTSEEA